MTRTIPYVAHAEIGITEVWTIQPRLTDGEVEKALRWLIQQLNR